MLTGVLKVANGASYTAAGETSVKNDGSIKNPDRIAKDVLFWQRRLIRVSVRFRPRRRNI
jgi:hypothetical protein